MARSKTRRRLQKPRSSAPAAPARKVGELALVPGALTVRVYRHDIAARDGAVRCWSYVSAGLASAQRPEIVFTLELEPGEADDAFPPDPLHLLTAFHQGAAAGVPPLPGDVLELGGKRLFAHHVLYLAAQPLDGVALPERCLAIAMISPDELAAVRQFGALRVIARLGQVSGHFPCPPWSARQRRGLALRDTIERSALAKLPRASIPQLYVNGNDREITIRARRGAQYALQRLREAPDGVAIALLPGLDPLADGLWVWEPGQRAPTGIAPPDSLGVRVAGCFIVFLPDQPANGGVLLEDGYALKLTTAAWRALRDALIGGTNLELPGSDGKAFALVWTDASLPTPRGASDWNTFRAAAGAPAGEDARDSWVQIAGVQVVTPADQLAARSSPRDIAQLCLELQRLAERIFGDREAAFEATVRVRCSELGFQLELTHRGDSPPALLQQFHAAARQLPKLPVRGGEIVFDLFLATEADD